MKLLKIIIGILCLEDYELVGEIGRAFIVRLDVGIMLNRDILSCG